MLRLGATVRMDRDAISCRSQHLGLRDDGKQDFELFKYDFADPSNKMPTGEIDLDEAHAKPGE